MLKPNQNFALLLLIVLACVSLAQFVVVDPFPAGELPGEKSLDSLPAGGFSIARAYSHLITLAQAPRHPGSLHHSATRDYLLQYLQDLGLETQVQHIRLPEGKGELENVLGRWQGRQSGPSPGGAILLVAHYDTAVNAPGAGDNASGVAIVLEILRAATQEVPLDKDLLVLFSDGEELGMLGAKAFAQEHPWMQTVQVALNFDSIKDGPAFMWQTSQQNGWLIEQYAGSVRSPAAASWFYDLSRLLPLGTDLTPLLDAGAAGYNFSTAYLYPEIHTPADQAMLVHPGSLRHAGEQGLSLVRHLGQAGITPVLSPDEVFFNLWGPLFIHYPAGLALPLALGVSLLFGAVVGLGIKKGILTWKDLFQGIISFQVVVALVILLALLVWLGGIAVWPGRFVAWFTNPSHLHYDWLDFSALVALAGGVFIWRYRSGLQKYNRAGLTAGVLFHWLALMLLSSALLPGASFLLTWPLCFSLLAQGWLFLAGPPTTRSQAWQQWGAGLVGAAPAVLLWTPFIFLVFLATGMGIFPILLVCILLFMGIGLPVFSGEADLVPEASFSPQTVVL